MPKLLVHDCAIEYQVAGTGFPLLLIPGALGTGGSDFAPQIPVFRQSYEVIAVDPRGYGGSRPPQRDFPVDFYQRDAEDMLALMTALGHEEFFVLGWSDGANIATLMAIHAPARIRKLVVWGGNSFLSPEEMTAFQAIRSLSAWSSREVETLAQIYGDSLAGLWEGYVDGLERIFAAGGDLYRTQLDRVVCPTFVLHGELDPLVPSFHPRIISEGIRDSRLHVFPEGKHRIHAKYAAEFNQRTEQFLRGL